MTKKLVKGQDVYIVPYDSRNKPFHAKVIGLGSKYITVSWLHYTENIIYICQKSIIKKQWLLMKSEKRYITIACITYPN